MYRKVNLLLHWLTALALCCTVIAACSGFTTKVTRKELLQEAIQSFHLTLITQHIPSIMRHVPAENREKWEKPFRCLFTKVRFDDFTIEMVQVRSEVNEAQVSAAITGHRLNSLVTHEFSVKEKWIYKDKGWFVASELTDFKEFLKDCLPDSQDP